MKARYVIQHIPQISSLVIVEFSERRKPLRVQEFGAELRAAFRYCEAGMKTHGYPIPTLCVKTQHTEDGAQFSYPWVDLAEGKVAQ